MSADREEPHEMVGRGLFPGPWDAEAEPGGQAASAATICNASYPFLNPAVVFY